MYRLHLLRIFRSINATATDYVLRMYPEARTLVVSPSINIEWKSLGDISRVLSLVALKGLQRVRRGGGEVGSTKARDKLQNPGGLCKTRNAQTAERHPERSGKGIPERASERRNFAARLSPPSTGVCSLSPSSIPVREDYTMKYIFPRSLCIFAKYKLRARPNKSQFRKNNAIERDLSHRIPLGQSRLLPFARFFFISPEESVSDRGDRSIMLLKSTLSAGRIS